jgi:DNA-binding MarR family transcriptional regulator
VAGVNLDVAGAGDGVSDEPNGAGSETAHGSPRAPEHPHSADASAGRQRPFAGNGFLLAQLGAHATERYAERVSQLELTPAHTGALLLIAQQPGQSQQALATLLGVVPSKIVYLVDDLEARHLLERRRNSADRRNYALHLTDKGQQAVADLHMLVHQHELDITAALTDEEQRQLTALLQKIADQQGLTPGVHPGYRTSRGASAANREGPPPRRGEGNKDAQS